MRVLALFLALAVGCAADDVVEDPADDPAEVPLDDEAAPTIALGLEGLSCRDALPAIRPDAPLFLYYGTYGARADTPATLALVDAPGEVVITLNRTLDPCIARAPELAPLRARGGLVGWTLSLAELNQHFLDLGTTVAADRVEAVLRSGYAYFAVDEVARKNTAWRDGGPRPAQFRALLEELARRGLDRRVILFMNSYHLDGLMHRYAQVLAAARDHARILASEIYLSTGVARRAASAPRLREEPNDCLRDLGCLESLAAEMGRAAPGINHRALTLLGVSDVYTGGRADALCDAPGGTRGGLYTLYARLHAGAHTRLQPGVGAYSPTRVRGGATWGPTEQAACLVRLNAWARWPDAR